MKDKKYREYVLGFIAILMLWYLASLIVKLPIVPSPFRVIEELFSLPFHRLGIHVLYSVLRIIEGLAISFVLGTSLGFLMGYFPLADRILSPLVYFSYPVPKIALLPVVMLLMGLGEGAKVTMIVLIVVFQILVASRDAVREIPKEAYYSLHSLGASSLQIFMEIVWPASLAKILTSMRVALGTAISVLFFTETYGTEYGLGYFIMDAWMRVNYLEMYCGILLLSIVGVLLFILVDAAQKRLVRW